MGSYIASLLLAVAFFGFLMPAMAHQPFFEDVEFTADNPKYIKDPTISTAVYAALETSTNVDYYTFNGSKGQTILLSITIPQITGQENFAPNMALMGPALPPADLPNRVIKPQNYGAVILPPPENATQFFDPFSRTSYWTRQEQNVTLPENSSYLVAVWDDTGEVGRYVFVIGYKEVLGGDPAFPLKMRNYWKPLVSASQAKNWTNVSADQQGNAQPGSTSTDQKTQPGFEAAFTLTGLVAVSYLILGRNLLGKM